MAKKKFYGKGKFANMPTELIMKPYPEAPFGSPEGLDDTIAKIDVQMRDELKGKKKGKYPEKF